MTKALDEGLELDICDAGDEVDIPEVTGSEEAFLRFFDEARAIPNDEVIPCRANTSVAFHNVKRGVEAVMQKRELVEKLPGVDVKRLDELPDLALGVVHAAALARRVGEASTSDYRSLLSRAHTARRAMLLSLEACAATNLVPKEEIAPIRRGNGPLDLAGDVVTLVSLFRKYGDVLKDKTPVSAAFLHEASEVGDALLRFLKPKGTPMQVKTLLISWQKNSSKGL